MSTICSRDTSRAIAAAGEGMVAVEDLQDACHTSHLLVKGTRILNQHLEQVG